MPLFPITVILSAFLLFEVQLILARYVLPWFGGSSSVWTTCLLFFQSLLPLGYLYAHLSRKLSIRSQGLLHIALIATALVLLPIAPGAELKPDEFGDPTFDIFKLLLLTVGVPFFLLSATAPLCQHWFSVAFPRRSPYRLYALSNAGSLLGLLSYPLLLEPHLTLAGQAGLWAYGFGAFALTAVGCIATMLRSEAGGEVPAGSTPATAIQPLHRALWLGLPALGAAMLLGTTVQVSMNLVAIPLIWVIPLSLYLISFIKSFY